MITKLTNDNEILRMITKYYEKKENYENYEILRKKKKYFKKKSRYRDILC